MLALLLALPALRADDKPKDEPKSPRAQYEALVTEFTSQRNDLLAQLRKASPEEQQKLQPKYSALPKEFAGKFFKLAEDNPKDPVAAAALIWVLQYGRTSTRYAKAVEKVTVLVQEMPLKDLVAHLKDTRFLAPPELLEALLKQAEKDIKAPEAADLLNFVAISPGRSPSSTRAIQLLLDNFPDSKGIEEICQGLSRDPQGADTLKLILQKSTQPSVKGAAALALARSLLAQADRSDDQAQADKTAAEAEKYLQMVLDQFGKDNPEQVKDAQRFLKILKNIRVGKVAPEISAGDLDEKPFKLSDYRGKVVLLDFWGNW
jgi:hypothetical protein